jgi:hypothetical protein
MNAPEHLTISGPEDILGYVPHTLGYWPSRSLVAMTMQGKRLGATLRVDLPECMPTRRGREDFARTVAEYLLADKDADGTLLIFFTDDSWADDAGPPGSRSLLTDLEPALGLAGMPVRDAWYVGAEYWRNVYCTDTGCCPLPGRPLAEIRDSRLNAEMVYLGSSVGAAPGSGPAAGSGPGENPAVMEAEGRWAYELCAGRSSREQFETVLDTWQAALAFETAAALPCDLAGFLRATLCVPSWRDAVLVMAAADRATALAGAEQFGIFSPYSGPPAAGPSLPDLAAGPALPDLAAGMKRVESDSSGRSRARTATTATTAPDGSTASGPTAAGGPGAEEEMGTGVESDPAALPGYGEVLLGLNPRVPDWTTMKSLEDVMLQLVSYGPGEAQAAAWTAKGWIEWCRGRGSFAHASLSQALDATPGYRLAELLSEVVRRGTICGWAGRKEAAWQRFGMDAA